jgi:hypothetical protein
MSPVVRLVAGPEPEQVFVPIEDIPLVLSDLRCSLPELTTELCSKWPVETVCLEEQKPFRKNPVDPSQVIPAACIGILVIFASSAAKAAGTKIGDAIGDEVTPHVRRWVKANFAKLKRRTISARRKKAARRRKREVSGRRK